MLHVAGVGMAEAESGELGLSLIDENAYDVILLDLRMPGMDGLTVIDRVRGRGDDKASLPIVVLTADTAVDLRERCLAAGADDVLFKPVAMEALFDSIGRVLASRQGDSGIIA